MSKKVMMMAGGGVLLLGAVGAGLYFSGMIGGADETPEEEVVEEVAPPGVLELDPFLTNIADPRGQRAARLRVKLVIAPAERIPEIEADALLMARLRDQTLSLLTAKTYAELGKPEGKEQFRGEVREKLAGLIVDGELQEILFSDFIVQ